MNRQQRLALPQDLRPGRRFDQAAAQKREKWLRMGTMDNRAKRRAAASARKNVREGDPKHGASNRTKRRALQRKLAARFQPWRTQ
jgi:hypothetical protein